MRKLLTIAFIFIFLLGSQVFLSAGEAHKHYEGSGEVLSVDPLYSRVTIKHGPIHGLAGDGDTEFFVTSVALLKNISKRDLVDFSVLEDRGNTLVDKITKTGVAPIKDDSLRVGQAVQDVLVATGEVAKVVTSPIAPAHEVVSGAVGATTGVTGVVLEDATLPSTKKEF